MNISGALGEELERRLAGRREPFAIFDFDNTCIVGDIGEALWEHLITAGRLSGEKYERYRALLAGGKVTDAYLLYGTILDGFTEDEATDAVRATLDSQSALKVHSGVRALMNFLQKKGVAVWIISASHEVAVCLAMENFGIEAKLIGIRNILKDGKYTAALEQPASMLEGKVDCMRAYIHPDASPLLVIDDSPTGLPLLETADIKVVVDHGQSFAEEARRRGWFIL